jgi:hypothetical protein
MTELRPSGLRRALHGRPRLTLHRYASEVTVDAAVAARLGGLAALATQASSTVGPPSERATKEVLSAIESHLLAELERPDADRDAALARADGEIADVRSRLEHAAREAAPEAYLTGVMATASTIAFGAGVGILAGGDALGARGVDLGIGLIAGVLGATFSLMRRLERWPTRPGTPLAMLRLLGLARPLIGGLLGLLIAGGLTAGLLPEGDLGTAILGVVAFVAGFAERLIGDVAAVKRGCDP